MPKVTREDIPNWFQKKTSFDVDIQELQRAAELDHIACADEPMKLMRKLWGLGPRESPHGGSMVRHQDLAPALLGHPPRRGKGRPVARKACGKRNMKHTKRKQPRGEAASFLLYVLMPRKSAGVF